MKAILRKDLQDEELTPPHFPEEIIVPEHYWRKAWECWQPECQDDKQWNTFLDMPIGVIAVNSIDFEFVE